MLDVLKWSFVVVVLASVSTTAIATEEFRIPTDPKAVYKILEVWKEGDLTYVVSNRWSRTWGDSYSLREIDCKAARFRYLGDGETLKEMERSRTKFESDPMSMFEASSVSHYISSKACGRTLPSNR